MFDLDQFVADCRTAIAQDSSQKSVREVVARAVSHPAAVLKGIGEPKRAAIQPLYRARSDGRVESAGARAICAKDAYPLGPDIIHSVTNPLSRLTGALQVYGGDLYGVIRSEWDAETLCEQRVQAAPSVGLFEAANAAMRL